MINLVDELNDRIKRSLSVCERYHALEHELTRKTVLFSLGECNGYMMALSAIGTPPKKALVLRYRALEKVLFPPEKDYTTECKEGSTDVRE